MTIYVPSTTQTHFVALFANEVQRQLEALSDASRHVSTRAYVSALRCGRSAYSLRLSENVPRGKDSGFCVHREPDAMFAHYRAPYPGVVVEVSFPYVMTRAVVERFFRHSGGEVKMVIVFELEFAPGGGQVKDVSQKAVVSVWQAQYEVRDGRKVTECPFEKAVVDHEVSG